ncbi:hypothetical protein BC939DRAFT_464090 [Gamsiella multidivaricata]|uniref:uncharacterized protein n=1 Tax=Gamsiella multidivaricata TaxID=101098 RepID=UPI00221E4FFA|nr:uncharacterized protein BC939DRAFT_464090 [Gamsiella multidivaricata]KAI7818028.1 hypothetical protein BC939DRAFT_464090 [Gamsiella multidivaricata]
MFSPVPSAKPSSSLSLVSPVLSSATTTASSSCFGARRNNTPKSHAPPKSGAGGKEKGHIFTRARETYIAELLADPDTWALFDDPAERNNHHRPKTDVREGIAWKINSKFSTGDSPVNFDSFQIKNKIENMKRVWKKANNLFSTTGNADKRNQKLRKSHPDLPFLLQHGAGLIGVLPENR